MFVVLGSVRRISGSLNLEDSSLLFSGVFLALVNEGNDSPLDSQTNINLLEIFISSIEPTVELGNVCIRSGESVELISNGDDSVLIFSRNAQKILMQEVEETFTQG